MPARPEKVSSSAPWASAKSTHSRQIAGGGDAGGVHPVRLGRGRGERGGVLGDAGDLDADDVVGALADEAGAVEDLAELRAEVAVGRAEHEGGHPGGGLTGVRRAAQAGDRAGADALGDVAVGQRALRLDEALGEQQHGACGEPIRSARAPTVAGRPADGTARQTRSQAAQLDVGAAADGDLLGELHPGQVLLVLALPGDLRGLLLGAGAELDLHAAAREQDRDGGPPAPGADHGRLAQRRQAAQPLPLELDVRPDPVGDGRRELRARGARSAGRSSACRRAA